MRGTSAHRIANETQIWVLESICSGSKKKKKKSLVTVIQQYITCAALYIFSEKCKVLLNKLLEFSSFGKRQLEGNNQGECLLNNSRAFYVWSRGGDHF